MNAHPKFLASTAHVDEAAVKPLPQSRKVYIEGSQSGVRVPMREISQSDTPASFGVEKNPPIYVYDTSGPYTDPSVAIDIRAGLAPLRQSWIEQRGDTRGDQLIVDGRQPRRTFRVVVAHVVLVAVGVIDEGDGHVAQCMWARC